MLKAVGKNTTATPERKWTTVRAVVTRADGTVEDRGMISFQHRNPIISAIGNLYVKANHAFGEFRRNRRKRS